MPNEGRREKNAVSELIVQPRGLAVDDDPVYQRNFVTYLSDAGLRGTKASSLAEASELLDKQFFHVALVDLSLAGDENRDGLRVLHKINAQLREGTSAILLTAYGTVEEGAEAEKLGAFEVLFKPRVSYAAMVPLIQKAEKRASEELRKYDVGINLLASGPSDERPLNEAKIVSAVSAAGFQITDELIRRLTRDLYPLLRLKQKHLPTIDQGRSLVKGTYWSKMLAEPIDLLVGKTPAVDDELSKFRQDPSQYAEGRYHRIIKLEELSDASGVVFLAKTPDFHEFERHQDPVFQS